MSHLRLKAPGAAAAIIALTLLFFWQILLTNLILVGVDSLLYFYPYKAYAAALREGRLPLWNPHLFLGAPFLANSQAGLFYPLNWPLIWLDPPKQVAWTIGLHIALAGLGMLLLVRRSLGLGWTGALVAAIIFAFGGYLGAQVEHVNQLSAAAWLPFLFLLYDLSLCRRFWLFPLALVAALTLLAGHAQTVFISFCGLCLYALRLSEWREKHLHEPLRLFASSLIRHLWPLGAAACLGAALAAVQLVPTAELSALSLRSGGLTFREAVSFSVRPGLLHYSLLPPLGLNLTQAYSEAALGEAFGEWVAYVGVSGLILALLGAVSSIWEPKARRFVVVAGGGLALSLGLYSGPLYALLFYGMPGFGLFRVPARWLLLYAFGAATLAGYGIQALGSPGRVRAMRGWGTVLLLGLPLVGLLLLIFRRPPPAFTLAAWLVLAVITLALVATHRQRLLTLLLVAELLGAAQSLNYNQPTAPQAYSSMRNAVAFLRSAEGGEPARFLSLSGTTYDPGDLHELEQLYGSYLTDKALYNLIVATKAKEVLSFNLPMLYGLDSVDGYDGGILPLAQFMTLQRLFLPEDDLSPDGRLREKLRFVPPGRLLSLLNTRWIITDKQFDAWIDGIFYDLQFPAILAPGESIATTDIPATSVTAIGLVSHLENGAGLPGGAPVADITLTFADGLTKTFTLRVGTETAEGVYPPDGAAHPPARVGVAWPYGAGGVDYVAVYTLTHTGQPITRISCTAILPAGRFVLRGLSLIHQPTTTSRSVILSTEGDYRLVHSGDVKIYENRAVLPRAYIVHEVEVVPDNDRAVAALTDPAFDPAQKAVRISSSPPLPTAPPTPLPVGEGSSLPPLSPWRPKEGGPGSEGVTFTTYEPERVILTATLTAPGWLVLSDTYYPGWQATVDGRPAEIFPANIMLRGVALPPGEHRVAFEFKPRSLQIGAWVTGVAVVVWVVGIISLLDKKSLLWYT